MTKVPVKEEKLTDMTDSVNEQMGQVEKKMFLENQKSFRDKARE